MSKGKPHYIFDILYSVIGVVGVDATLDEIEQIINNEQWGSVYAFLIDNEGATIFHPRMKASSKVNASLLVKYMVPYMYVCMYV